MDTTKYVGMDVHTEAISVAVRNSAGKGGDGIHPRDEGKYHSGVYRRATRQRAGDLRRRHLGRVVVRLA
jgi:hypothetical protein